MTDEAVDFRNGEVTGEVTFPLQAGGQGERRGRVINAIPHVLTLSPDPSSQESVGSTSDSTKPDGDTRSSPSPTATGGTSSPPAGPESPSTTTYETWALERNPDGTDYLSREETPTLRSNAASRLLTFSVEGSPAKTSASPDNDAASPENDPDSSSSTPESQTLFDPDGYSSRTYPVSSLATAVGTSESSLERWPTSGTAWRGGLSTHVSSECRSDDAGCSSSEPSLTEILEPPQNVPGRYSLSARAATGILRRAQKRGRELPSHLQTALEMVSQGR